MSRYKTGFIVGWLTAVAGALLAVHFSGCRLEPADTATARTEAERSAWRDALRAELREVNARRNYPATPNTSRPEQANVSAAKVAAVMAEAGITLPQVAAWLNTYGFDVVNRTSTLRPHWTPAPPGRDAQGNIVPVAYYVANIRIAVGDTTLAIYAPQAVGPVWMRVKAYDGRGMSGIWSATEVSGSGALLPGVAEQ